MLPFLLSVAWNVWQVCCPAESSENLVSPRKEGLRRFLPPRRITGLGVIRRALLVGGLAWGLTSPGGLQGSESDDWQCFHFQRIRMGVPWEIQIYATEGAAALQAAEAAFARIKQLDEILSDYDPDSELRQLCARSGPGQPIRVSADLLKVLQVSQELSCRTAGAFDVTVGPLTDLWRRAWRKRAFPEEADLNAALAKVGYRQIRLNPQARTVELQQTGMRLDLGAIAKGYAADEALKTLREHGFSRVLVDASGDLSIGDPPPGRDHWVIAIEPLKHPADAATDGAPKASPPQEHLALKNIAVATSGDANRFVEIDGVRYSHLVNPHTGLGLTTFSSVTVIAANGMLADALASAVAVLGPEESPPLLKHYQAEAFITWRVGETLHQKTTPGYPQHRSPQQKPTE